MRLRNSPPGTSIPSACAPSRWPASSPSRRPTCCACRRSSAARASSRAQAFVDAGPAAPEDRRPEGLARRRHRLAPADRGRARAGRLPRGPRPRASAAVVAGVEVQNFYIPAGGDVPDRAINPKFDHKLDFFERLTAEMARARSRRRRWSIAGDLNVAPGENDVWNHRYMSKVVSHTPVEVEAMEALKAAGGFIDLVREARPGAARSWPPGGATAPPTSAPRTGACGWTTLGHARACATPPSAWAPPPPASTTTSAPGSGPATTPR